MMSTRAEELAVESSAAQRLRCLSEERLKRYLLFSRSKHDYPYLPYPFHRA